MWLHEWLPLWKVAPRPCSAVFNFMPPWRKPYVMRCICGHASVTWITETSTSFDAWTHTVKCEAQNAIDCHVLILVTSHFFFLLVSTWNFGSSIAHLTSHPLLPQSRVKLKSAYCIMSILLYHSKCTVNFVQGCYDIPLSKIPRAWNCSASPGHPLHVTLGWHLLTCSHWKDRHCEELGPIHIVCSRWGRLRYIIAEAKLTSMEHGSWNLLTSLW